MLGLSLAEEVCIYASRVNVCPPRQYPFKTIQPPEMLSNFAQRLFSLHSKSAEIVQPVVTLKYCAELAEKVEKVKYQSIMQAGGDKRNCHFDTCRIYKPDTHDYYTGFTLMFIVDRLTWQAHSWLMEGETLIETTPTAWDSYYGLKLNPEQAAAHCEYITGGEVLPSWGKKKLKVPHSMPRTQIVE